MRLAGSGTAGPPLRRALAWAARNLAPAESWFLLIPVCLGIGICLYFGLKSEPDWGVTLTGLALTFALALGLHRRAGALSVLLLSVAIGFAAGHARTALQATVMLERPGWATVTGRLATVETRIGDRRLTVDGVSLFDTGIQADPSAVRVLDRSDRPLPPVGSRVRFRARLSPPGGPITPDGFDFQRHAYFLGIGGVGFVAGPVEALGPAPEGPMSWLGSEIRQLRVAIGGRVRTALDPETGAIAAALLVGDRSAIAPADLEVLRETGLAHLLAISGLHMGLVAGAVLLSVRFALALVPSLALRWPTKKVAAGAALIAAAGYLVLAGAPVPTQRAFVMTGLVLVAILCDREALSLRLVALAAGLVLLLFPESLLGPSFQMSFAAVTALIVTYQALRDRWPPDADRPRHPVAVTVRYFGAVALTSLVAGLATAPFAAHHFQQVPVLGGLANLAAVPLTAFLTMPSGVLAVLMLPLGLEAVPLAVMGWGIEATLWTAEQARTLPVTALRATPAPGPVLAALVLGGVAAAVWRGPVRGAGILAMVVGVVLWARQPPPSILLAGAGDLVGLRFADGAWAVSTTRRHGFVREGWRERWGGGDPVSFESVDRVRLDDRGGGFRYGALRCDERGCVHVVAGHRIAILNSAEASAEDCRLADFVVALVPLRTPCPAAGGSLDLNDLRRFGAHAVWIDTDGIRIRSVGMTRGNRPWALDWTR